MTAWALFCHDFDLSKGINILSEKCPVVLDHYKVKSLTGVHIEFLTQKIEELTQMKATLQAWSDACTGDNAPDCPILKGLAEGGEDKG